jgi:dTDP-4-dehydrorhamnose reductase
MFNAVTPNFVINCAAYTAVDKAESDRELAWKLNADAVKNLATASDSVKAYFIHISTDYVFDGEKCTPYTENDSVNPQSEYGRSKLVGESYALHFNNAMIIRTAWLYSSFGNNFVKTMRRLGSERESLNVVFDQTGTPTNAKDLAATILEIIGKVSRGDKQFQGGVYHFSNEGVCSWYDFACAVMSLNALDCRINPIRTDAYPTPARRPKFSVLDKSKIKTVYDVSIKHWYKSLCELENVQ